MTTDSFVLGMITGVTISIVFVAIKNHAKSRCYRCSKILKGMIIAHKGKLFCSYNCALEIATLNYPFTDAKKLRAECEEININDIGG